MPAFIENPGPGDDHPSGPLPGGRRPEPAWILAVRRFARRYGWRAYALPVLVVVTVVSLATLAGGRGHSVKAQPVQAQPGKAQPVKSQPAAPTPSVAASTPVSAPTTAAVTASTPVKMNPTASRAEGLASDQLPPGPAYTMQGKGTFAVVPGTTPVIGSGPVRHYVIEIENGIAGVDPKAFAATVVATLDDPRSWTGGEKNLSLQRVASDAQADFRIALTTSISLRPFCGYELKVETSCWDDQNGPSRVYLNLARWVRGDASFGQDLAAYHLYMINHEAGHALGHVHTFTCLPNGSAPVMMQQTLTLKENEGAGPKTCTPNAWPYPVGVAPQVAVPS